MLVIWNLLTELFSRKPASWAALQAQTRHALADASRRNAEALHVMGMGMGMGKRLEDRYATANAQFFARVRDGDRVRAGEIVVRLDETITRASRAMLTKSLDQLEARQARLEAEREGRETIAFPDTLATRALTF